MDYLQVICKIGSTAYPSYMTSTSPEDDPDEPVLLSENMPLWGIFKNLGAANQTWRPDYYPSFAHGGDENLDSMYGSDIIFETDTIGGDASYMRIGHWFLTDPQLDGHYSSLTPSDVPYSIVEKDLRLYDLHAFSQGLLPNLHNREFYVNIKGRKEI